jgi:hypothetical protein
MSWRKDRRKEEMDARPPKLGQGEVKIKSIRHHQKLCPYRTKERSTSSSQR